MDTEQDWMTAGLVFLGDKTLDMVEITNRVINSFEFFDDEVTNVRVLSDTCASLTTRHFSMRFVIFEDVKVVALDAVAERFLAIQITNGDNTLVMGVPNPDAALANALKSLYAYLSPDYVKWIGKGAIFSRSEFETATADPDTCPAEQMEMQKEPLKGSDCLPPIDETNNLLQQRLAARQAVGEKHFGRASDVASHFEDPRFDSPQTASAADDDREQAPALRLSAWFVSFAVTLFTLPVGLTLIIINLFKGESLRLNSQAMALTGTFTALQSTGSTAQAMTTIKKLLH